MSVDFGNEFMKIAIVKVGTFLLPSDLLMICSISFYVKIILLTARKHSSIEFHNLHHYTLKNDALI